MWAPPQERAIGQLSPPPHRRRPRLRARLPRRHRLRGRGPRRGRLPVLELLPPRERRLGVLHGRPGRVVQPKDAPSRRSATAPPPRPRASSPGSTWPRSASTPSARARTPPRREAVAVLLDYGTDEGNGTRRSRVPRQGSSTRRPAPRTSSARSRRSGSSPGSPCAIDGYPATGCGEPVKDAQVPADEQRRLHPALRTTPRRPTRAPPPPPRTTAATCGRWSASARPWSCSAAAPTR